MHYKNAIYYLSILPKHLMLALKHFRYNRFGYCNVCGRRTFFYCDNPDGARGSFVCLFCLSRSRNRHVAKIFMEKILPNEKSIKASLEGLKGKIIYEASAFGPLHNYLSKIKGYVCSDYQEGVKAGELMENGVRCENLECLSFESNSMDIVITEDVLEHVREPEKAWAEIRRVLKPGGYHIFTIPFNYSNKTFKRVKHENGKEIQVVPPRYHGDYLRSGGILVYTDYGVDLLNYLGSINMPTEIYINNYIDSIKYGIYESMVFCSRKVIA